MKNLKRKRQKIEQQCQQDIEEAIDKAVETRIRCLDVLDRRRDLSNEARRTERAKKAGDRTTAGETNAKV